MHVAQTSEAHEAQEVSASDLRLLAINVARLTQCPSNRQRDDRYFAAIASARIERPNKERNRFHAS